ncbi:flagellar hook-associated protein FlgK [Aneurinibacillus aneurinilyticus]|jgi:flagellar hook-associated protein 1 FlgK|uniref:Flagellar hook-associated protein 1 n=2 Tax=Aneurinibacillus aneurinilyticus TaxID=1391 RepID=A0A848D3G3_ANEAE|nr:flagellar hook-associated protein FlgK [Aneurinibacillus aneurinilyticus]ERI09663.1 flagellar hook-associated protein FlgK [Aneurinibacillus aneurinilyticus ATCC 12856]MCI1693971.1 flagellar hook-associated protein FlgK [Aneurinibacillus aneurinilyticus]MED0708252.1 flagellar hook-associated protein FlgK [Aneurinibacillus aneurinilyticus]MED0724678.1 flagellar hook-associated protein FlgK [Aneurinibacillus aneurinilyticus]MED0730567.1 flagellar hook-associated protein FlgK [Aneurinibacillus
MPSAFSALEIGKRALFANQGALNTIGHNIANANTEGYTRQRVNLQATSPYPYPALTNARQAGQMGTGVVISSIERLRERFLDLQFRGEYKKFGYYEKKSDTLGKIESILNEPSDKGFQYTMDEFWTAWHTLASDPQNKSAREAIRQNGIAVADNFKYVYDSLNEMKNNLNKDIGVKADEINSYVKQITALNEQIADVVPHGYEPNDLYDQRDLLLDKLSKLIDIDVTPSKDGMGMVDVKLKAKANDDDGTAVTEIPLISGREGLEVKAVDKGGKLQVQFTQAGSPTKTYSDVEFASGDMAGLFESRDKIVEGYLDRINLLATTFAEKLNEVHQQGIDLNGDEGVPFFVSKDDPPGNPKNAADMVVNPDIIKSVNKIAAGKNEPDGTAPGKGDNKNALAIFALKTDNTIQIGTEKSSFDGYTKGIITTLGLESREAQRMRDNTGSLLLEVENRRQSIYGVQPDEEIADMIRFQHAYNAAARSITVADEVLDKIINGMGLVGR